MQLAAALLQVTQGQLIRSVAKQYNVTRHWLTARFNCKPLKRHAQEHHQALTEEQERQLVAWVLLQGRLSWAPTHGRFRQFAESILNTFRSHCRLRKRWHHRFFKRLPQVKTLVSIGMDFQRLNGASRQY